MASVGIDFGTHTSTVAYSKEGKILAARSPVSGKKAIPSLIYYGPDETLVGENAKELWKQVHEHGFPERRRTEVLSYMVPEIKDRLEPDGQHALPGRVVSHEQVVADILSHIKAEVEEHALGASADRVMLTHSVRTLEPQKELLRAAGRRAGFTDVELLEKPVAAAMGYVAAGETVGTNILVYDLGATLFEVAMVAGREDGSHVIVESASDASCGGGEFDHLIYDYVERQLGVPQSGQVDRVTLDKCRRAKEALSRQAQDTIFVDYTGEEGQPGIGEVILTRKTFESLVRSSIDTTVRKAVQVAEAAASQGHQVDTLVLVGASTQIPLVRQLLRESFGGVNVATMREPDTAVAMGAMASRKGASNRALWARVIENLKELRDLGDLSDAPSPGVGARKGLIATLKNSANDTGRLWS